MDVEPDVEVWYEIHDGGWMLHDSGFDDGSGRFYWNTTDHDAARFYDLDKARQVLADKQFNTSGGTRGATGEPVIVECTLVTRTLDH